MSKRASLFGSLVIGKATYNVGTWHGLIRQEEKAWCRQVARMYRALIPQKEACAAAAWPHHVLAGKVNMPHPLALIAVARIKLMVKLVAVGDLCLLSMLAQDQSDNAWQKAVCADVAWAVQVVPHCDVHAPITFCTLVAKCRQGWNVDAWLSEVVETHVADLRAACDTALTRLEIDNASAEHIGDTLSDGHGNEPPCPLCQVEVKSRSQFASHLWLVHGIKSKWRHYVGESCQCQACGQQFSTRERAVAHLQRETSGCREFLVRTFCPLDEAHADHLDEQDAQRKRDLKRTGVRPAEHRFRCRATDMRNDLTPLPLGKPAGFLPVGIEDLCYGRSFVDVPQVRDLHTRLQPSYAVRELHGQNPT